jgi:hypothetical protein
MLCRIALLVDVPGRICIIVDHRSSHASPRPTSQDRPRRCTFPINLLHVDVAGRLDLRVPKLTLYLLVGNLGLMVLDGRMTTPEPVIGHIRDADLSPSRFEHVSRPIGWNDARPGSGRQDERLGVETVRVTEFSPPSKVLCKSGRDRNPSRGLFLNRLFASPLFDLVGAGVEERSILSTVAKPFW